MKNMNESPYTIYVYILYLTWFITSWLYGGARQQDETWGREGDSGTLFVDTVSFGLVGRMAAHVMCVRSGGRVHDDW